MTNKDKFSQLFKEPFGLEGWRELSDEWEKSSETQKSFCERKSVRLSQFTAARTHLRGEKNITPRLEPLGVGPATSDQPAVQSQQGMMRLILSNGAELVISPGADCSSIRAIVQSLMETSCYR